MGPTLKFYDYKHRLGLMNNLVNYFGLNIIENESYELD
jgi:hypothetical protein